MTKSLRERERMAGPIGYMRKSVVRDVAHTASPAVQEDAIRALDAWFGDDGDRLTLLAVWDVSGRSVAELAHRFDLCMAHKVPIRVAVAFGWRVPEWRVP
jgi:hypothetical protein